MVTIIYTAITDPLTQGRPLLSAGVLVRGGRARHLHHRHPVPGQVIMIMMMTP